MFVQGESLKAQAALLTEAYQLPDHQAGEIMKTCAKCDAVYADNFATCPHCYRVSKIGCVGWIVGGCAAAIAIGLLVDHSPPKPPLDFSKPIFTKPRTYGCGVPEDLRGLTASAMDQMDRLGGTVASCAAFPTQRVLVIQRSASGSLVKVSIPGRPRDETEAVALWVFSGDLTN